MTYDEAQVAKPLKRCAKCQREWYMLADVCAECCDAVEVRPGVWRSTRRSASIFADVRDVNGVVIDGP